MSKNNSNAALIIIGNEILSGRTQDININFIAKQLGDIGIKFMEARVVPDIEQMIIDAVNDLHIKYDYVFTTGGIGPTHDDITTASIAKAFGLDIERRAEVVEKLRIYYEGTGRELNDARLKMADFPEGAEFLENPISTAPGFKIDNVFVMAGIPNVMQAMFMDAKRFIVPGHKILSREISAVVGETKIAAPLTALQEKYPDVEMGSYPFVKDFKFCTSIALRSTNEQDLEAAYEEVSKMMHEHSDSMM